MNRLCYLPGLASHYAYIRNMEHAQVLLTTDARRGSYRANKPKATAKRHLACRTRPMRNGPQPHRTRSHATRPLQAALWATQTNTPSPSHGSRDCQRSALTSRARRRVGVANSPSPLVLLLLLLATAAAAAALSTTPPSEDSPCVRARARPQFITPRQRGEPQ